MEAIRVTEQEMKSMPIERCVWERNGMRNEETGLVPLKALLVLGTSSRIALLE